MRKLVLIAALASISFFSFAQYTMCSSNNWNGATAWINGSCGSGNTTIPNCSSSPCSTNATINGVTATVNGNFGVNNLTLNMNSTLTISLNQTLTVYGDLIIAANINGINLNGGTLIVKGNVIIQGNFNLNVGSTTTTTPPNGYFEVGGNFTTCTNGTITCSSPPTYNVNVSTNYTNSGALNQKGSVLIKGSVDLPGTGSNISGSSGTVSVSGSCIPAGSSSNQTFCYKGNISGTIMPITLSDFYSSIGGNNIILNWSTSSEFNFDYFSLQKSGDGKSFKEIAQVKGHGTTNDEHEYQFEDNFPLIGKNYYRLTSVDFDNYRETFKVIVQNYSGEKNFQVSPNPSDGRTITLNFNFESTGGQVVIYDSMGSIVESFQVDKAGQVSFANNLKDGIYFVKYSASSYTRVIRFLVRQ